MNPLDSVQASQYKEVKFFPCISDEYRQSIRDVLFVAPSLELEEEKERRIQKVRNKEKNYPFNEILEKPKSFNEGDMFDLMKIFQGTGETGLVRCLKSGGNDDVTFEGVDPVTSLKGKHVLLVCSFVPSKWSDYNGERLSRLWILSKEMALNDSFEILIVAKMRNKYASNRAAYNHFLSGFPNRLAISFDRPDLGDELCNNLGFDGALNGILIDPNGKIVQDHIGFIEKCGGGAFPFTCSDIDKYNLVGLPIFTDHQIFGDTPLVNLLRCNSSTRLYKFGFPSESITIEKLSKELVGLYLFRVGDKLDRLHEIYHLCQLSDKARNAEPQFQIVLFCLPLTAIDPATFQLEVYELLNQKPEIDVASWWVFPYDNSTALRLSTRFMRRRHFSDSDDMITVGPDGKFVDFFGGDVLINFGYEAYPYSLKELIHRFVERADLILLGSLFKLYSIPRLLLVKQDGSHIDMKELQYKNVILYVDTLDSSLGDLSILIQWYPTLKQLEPDLEVVFVPYTELERGSVSQPKTESEIPWLLCPYYSELYGFLRHNPAFYERCDGNRLVRGLRPGIMVAFGKGGGIQILDFARYLVCQGLQDNPFSLSSRNLGRDIYRQMAHDMDFVASSELYN